MSEHATLKLGNQTLEFPTVEGTEGDRAIDIKPLRKQSGYITFDPGGLNTGACRSEITFIDGEKGILRYRGYPIEELAEHSTFTEVSYLLMEGELPSRAQLTEFESQLTYHTLIHENLKRMFHQFPPNAHPMAILSSIVGALSCFYQEDSDPLDPDHVRISSYRLLAKLPTIAAFSYKQSLGQAYIYPDNSLTYPARLLKMLFGFRTEPYRVDEDIVRALDQLLILHADHEQNCSTTTVRTVGSSQADLFASISAGISALSGPLHGGANQKVLEMLRRIREDDANVDKYVALARDKQSGFRLMGFGHRVYKNFDPRARILKVACDTVLTKLKVNDPLVEVARRLEEHALKDSYFVERNLYPNVDFYSGIIYRALGVPENMFTVMFALGRLPGWIAQWRESAEQNLPLTRPRQIYTGPNERGYVPIDHR